MVDRYSRGDQLSTQEFIRATFPSGNSLFYESWRDR